MEALLQATRALANATRSAQGVDASALDSVAQALATCEAQLVQGGSGADEMLPSRKGTGSDAQILKKVSTRLQDFEAQMTA
jgi:hypothetical protein